MAFASDITRRGASGVSTGGYEIDNSLRFNDDDSAYLNRTFGTATNRKIWTWSGWVKRGNITLGGTNHQTLFSTATANDQIRWRSTDDQLEVLIGGTVKLETSSVQRDTSAWYHILLVADSTIASPSGTNQRLRLYINGSQVTDFGTETYPALNATFGFNNSEVHNIARSAYDSNRYLDGYLAEVNFIDGQAKTTSDFGEEGIYGEWKPVEYTGTHGTNGFYLPFKQDATVEGFSAVTYTGTGVVQSITGVGFKPDLVWVKGRSPVTSHGLFDSVRGANKRLMSDNTTAEATRLADVNSFDADGWTTGRADGEGGYNDPANGGETYVGWTWDMGTGGVGLPHTLTAYGNAQHSTSTYKWGGSSIAFDGTGDYLQTPDSSDWDVYANTADSWTIDFWVKHTDYTGTEWYVDQYVGTTDRWGFYHVGGGSTSRGIHVMLSTSAGMIFNTNLGGEITDTNWHHLAFIRKGSQWGIYKDGTQVGYLNNTTTWTSSGNLYLGSKSSSSEYLDGNMDEFRITKSDPFNASPVSGLTDTITVPTGIYTTDANTKLLIHSDTSNGSTTFTDSSGAAKNTNGTITSYTKANSAYGQSIVSYTGNATAGATVGHGLSSAPDMIILKHRENNGESSRVYHSAIVDAEQKYMILNNSNPSGSSTLSAWNDTAPTADKFSIGNDTAINASGNGFIAYCFHSVAGYSKFGSYTGNGSTTGTIVTTGFRPAFLMVKRTNGISDWVIIDSARTPMGDIDNALNPNQTYAETTGYNTSFTATGFQLKTTTSYLNGSGDTYIYMAFADTREYSFFTDQSTNSNHWTPNNISSVADVMLDTPTNNFCTLNSVTSYGNTLLEGNLKLNSTANNRNDFGSFLMSSGKWYWEFCVLTTNVGAESINIGIMLASADAAAVSYSSTGYNNYSSWLGYLEGEGGYVSYGSSWRNIGDIIGVTFDADTGSVTFYNNNTSQGTAFTGLTDSTGYVAHVSRTGGTASVLGAINFGQDSSFAGNKTGSGTYADSGGIGDFFYEPPANFLALCSANLADPTVIPSKHFNTVTYTGNSSTQSITGVGFQPDLLWLKSRSTAYNNLMQDVVRGKSGDKYLYLEPSTTIAEGVQPDDDGVWSLDSDGFTFGWSNSGAWNYSGTTYVAWNWKAGGTPTTDNLASAGATPTAGSVKINGSNLGSALAGSIAATRLSANTDAGFSIVSYTGNATNATIGHGLASAPELLIVKSRDTIKDWMVHHDSFNGTKFIRLNLPNAPNTDGLWQNTAPTDSVFYVNSGTTEVNSPSGTKYIAYCFHSVDGYSKIGSYTGNGSTDGTFVYTGFRPAHVIVKLIDTDANPWVAFNTNDANYNGGTAVLYPSTSGAEESSGAADMDFLANGFKLRHSTFNGNYNNAGYIYIAFADQPFKHSNAR